MGERLVGGSMYPYHHRNLEYLNSNPIKAKVYNSCTLGATSEAPHCEAMWNRPDTPSTVCDDAEAELSSGVGSGYVDWFM